MVKRRVAQSLRLGGLWTAITHTKTKLAMSMERGKLPQPSGDADCSDAGHLPLLSSAEHSTDSSMVRLKFRHGSHGVTHSQTEQIQDCTFPSLTFW